MTTEGPADFALGAQIDGRYELVSLLGQGGYGAVYRARQLNMDREVAIKVIRPHLTSDERMVKRFLREARAVSRLKNPHIVPVYDSGQTAEGTLYLVMELIEGQSLKQVFATEAPLEPARLARLVGQVCEALTEAHGYRAAGSDKDTPLIHRDIKPENIIVSKTRGGSEHCYLLDFGIVRMEGEDGEIDASLTGGLALGTPYFMSPEQGFGEKVSPQSDLWALGVILFQGLSGQLPFPGTSVLAIMGAVTRDPTPPLEAPADAPPLPAELVQLVYQLLEKDPAKRPNSASEVQAILLGFAATGTPSTPVRPLPRAVRPAAPAVQGPVSGGTLAIEPVPAEFDAATPAASGRSWLKWAALAAVAGAAIAGAAIYDKQMTAPPATAPIVSPPTSGAEPPMAAPAPAAAAPVAAQPSATPLATPATPSAAEPAPVKVELARPPEAVAAPTEPSAPPAAAPEEAKAGPRPAAKQAAKPPKFAPKKVILD